MDKVNAEFVHMIVQSMDDLDNVREKVKKHKRANSIYASRICNYIAVAQNKIEEMLSEIND